mgnify:CR=1 FL=1
MYKTAIWYSLNLQCTCFVACVQIKIALLISPVHLRSSADMVTSAAVSCLRGVLANPLHKAELVGILHNFVSSGLRLYLRILHIIYISYMICRCRCNIVSYVWEISLYRHEYHQPIHMIWCYMMCIYGCLPPPPQEQLVLQPLEEIPEINKDLARKEQLTACKPSPYLLFALNVISDRTKSAGQ